MIKETIVWQISYLTKPQKKLRYVRTVAIRCILWYTGIPKEHDTWKTTWDFQQTFFEKKTSFEQICGRIV